MAKKKSGGSIGGFVFSAVNIGITIIMFITPTIGLAYWYMYLRDPGEPVANPPVAVAPAAQIVATEPNRRAGQPDSETRPEPAMSSNFFSNSFEELNAPSNSVVSAEPEPKGPARGEYETRTWSDPSGKFTIEAAFHSFTGGHVKLVALDDRRIDVPIAKLSDDDKEYLRGVFRDKGVQPSF